MAATGNFQLFPPHAQTTDTAVESNPYRKKKPQGSPVVPFAIEGLVKGGATESVVIHIVEEPKKMEPHSAGSGPRRAASKKAQKSAAAATAPTVTAPTAAASTPRASTEQTDKESPESSHKPAPRKLSRPTPPEIKIETGKTTVASASTIIPQNLPPPPPRPSSFYASALETRTDSPSPPTASPVATMTSMFPTYDHNLSLSQQHYYPPRQTSLPVQLPSRQEYRPRVASPSPLDEALGPKTAPSSVVNFSMEDLPIRGPQYSSPNELEKLWEATNGQDPQTVLPGFDLQMSRFAVL